MIRNSAGGSREGMQMSRGPLIMMTIAGAVALGATAALFGVAGEAVATTLGLGIAVAVAVYADRKWLRPSPRAWARALEYGAATAFGWAVAQIIINFS